MPTKAAQTAKMSARKKAPSTGGVRPACGRFSGFCEITKAYGQEVRFCSTGGVRPELHDSRQVEVEEENCQVARHGVGY